MSGATTGPITIEEVTGGHALRSDSVGKGYYGIIGCATQRDPHPQHGGGIDLATSKANALVWAAAPDLLTELRDFHDHTIDQGWHDCEGIPGGCPVVAALTKARGGS